MISLALRARGPGALIARELGSPRAGGSEGGRRALESRYGEVVSVSRLSGALRVLPALLVVPILAACGGGEQLSPADAGQLQATLDEVAGRHERGDCGGARTSTLELRRQIRGLDRNVDENLREGLRLSASRLASLVKDQCVEPPPPPAPAVSEPQTEQTEPQQTTPVEPQPDSDELQEAEEQAQAERERAQQELEQARQQRQLRQQEQRQRQRQLQQRQRQREGTQGEGEGGSGED